MSNKLFDVLNSIFYKKKIKYDKKDCNGYMLAMWLSHDKSLIHLVNDINPYIFSLKDDLIYKYFFQKIPKGRRFLKWTKKEPVDKKYKKRIDDFCERFEVSKMEAKKSIK